MEIRLSTPDLYFDKRVERAAADAGCFARIKWREHTKVRFVLLRAAGSALYASSAAHDNVIRELLTRHPQATIRTARAHYAGLDDFQRQKDGALA